MGKQNRHHEEQPDAGSSKKRFRFKSFIQRLEEVDIDVFRNVEDVKFEPSRGSSFFEEGLLHWRELNAAADFISVYDELLPRVCTLPQLLLHKTVVIDKLLKCLQPSAVLSLQPILSLICALSRDLGEDFLSFVPQTFDAFAQLLELGGDRDAAILEMVFTTILYIFKYLHKLLSTNIVLCLKITKRLRYYHQNYVRVFAAEAVAFLMRNAPLKEVIKGVRKALAEVEVDVREETISACSNLLYYTIKGTSEGTFHSRAPDLLQLLLHSSILGGIRKESKANNAVTEVLKGTFADLCEHLELDGAKILWSSLLDKLFPSLEILEKVPSIENAMLSIQLLALATKLAEIKTGRFITDYSRLFNLASRLLSTSPRLSDEAARTALLSHTFTFLHSLVRSHCILLRTAPTALNPSAPPWDTAFQSLEFDILLPFTRGLLDLNLETLSNYVPTILSVLERFMGSHQVQVLPLLLKVLEQTGKLDLDLPRYATLISSVSGIIEEATKMENPLIPEAEGAQIWFAIKCIPFLGQESVCLDYAVILHRLLSKDGVTCADRLERLLGAALSSHSQASVLQHSKDFSKSASRYFDLSLKHKSSPDVLEALVACVNASDKLGCREVVDAKLEAIKNKELFQENLGMPSKRLRLATLQFLSILHTQDVNDHQTVLDLLSIASSPLSVVVYRLGRSCSVISQIKLRIESKKVSSQGVHCAFHAMVGLLRHRFTPLWDPVVDCLISIIRDLKNSAIGEGLLNYISVEQHRFLTQQRVVDEPHVDEIVRLWRSRVCDSEEGTPILSMMTLLLRVAYSIPAFVESKSSELLHLFSNFIDYRNDGFQDSNISWNDWKTVLRSWLTLLEQLKSVRSKPEAGWLRPLLIDRLLTSDDPQIQKLALSCLLNWKDGYLIAYKDRLYNLLSLETLRDELLKWDISEEVHEDHRQDLIPIVLHILFPKMTKRVWKNAKTDGSRCVLAFLTRLEPTELGRFYCLMLGPLKAGISVTGSEATADRNNMWEAALERGDTTQFISWVDPKSVSTLPPKRKIGFLHLAKNMVDVFSWDQVEPYLPAVLALVLRILETSSISSDIHDISTSDAKEEKSWVRKDIRTLCLKFLSALFNKFDKVEAGSEYWDVLFKSTEHSITKMKEENAINTQPSATLTCFLAISKTPHLCHLLLRNAKLLPNVLAILVLKNVSPVVCSAVLGFVENVLAANTELVKLLLVPHLSTVLSGFAEQLSSKNLLRNSKEIAKRQLEITFRLGQFVEDSTHVAVFLDTLLPFLKPKKRFDTEICIQVLKVVHSVSHAIDAGTIVKCCTNLGPLLAHVESQEARAAICQVLQKVAQADPSFYPVAELIEDLNSMAASTVGEYDYDRRQKAYEKLNHTFFAGCHTNHAVLVLSQLIFDLRSEDTRYNASSCLFAFVKAVVDNILHQAVKVAVQEFLWSEFKNAIKSDNATLRMEWLLLFRELVNCGQSQKLAEFVSLIHTDPEQDFFGNIVHVQAHRRVKAMAKFRAVCTRAAFSQEAHIKVFIPLFTHSLFEPKTQNDGIVNAAVETLAYIAGELRPVSSLKLLFRSFRLLDVKREHQKTLVRLICTMVDKVRFVGEGTEEDCGSEKRLLSELEKLMLNNDTVSVPVVLAITKVLKSSKQDLIGRELPRLFQTVANLLKSRLQTTRNEARAAIVGMAETLGAPYLQFMVKTLQATLKRGYERHVLGYTVHSILSKLVPKLEVGEIDYCVKEVMDTIVNETFGEVSEEKEVEELTRKMMERKQVRSYDSLRLMAQVVTFPSRADSLLEPARENAARAKEKVQAYLKSLAGGIQANAAATEGRLLLFVRTTLDKFLQQETAQDDYLIAEFALELLHANLRNNQLRARDPETMTILDSYIGILRSCLAVKYDGVISVALRCLSIMSGLPLPAVDTSGQDIFSSAFSIARSNSNSENALLQACLKFLIMAIRHWKSLDLSENQLHSLLKLPIFIHNLEDAQALSLLKAIVERKLVVPELYDMMNRVQSLMITSQSSAIQKRCSEVLLQFLLDCPLGPKRLQQHIDFILSSLGYEHITGREAALEMLHAVICKFPVSVLEQQADSLFVTLVTRLLSEKTDHVRLLLETVGKVLMKRVGMQTLQRMKDFILTWMTGDKQRLWGPATQVAALLVEVMEKKFERHMGDFEPALMKLLKHSSSSGEGCLQWRDSFYLLTIIDKLARLLPDHNLHNREEVWMVASNLLLNNHAMVMKASSRIFGLYLENEKKPVAPLLDATWVVLLASHFCEQLNSQALDQELGEVATSNLSLLTRRLHTLSLPLPFSSEQQDDRLKKALSVLIKKEASTEDVSVLMLVVRRLEKVALRFRPLQTKYIVKWYSLISTRLQAEELLPYLPHVLGPLLKLGQSTETTDELKKYAEEVRNDVHRVVGAVAYAQMHNQLAQETRTRREKRKQQEAVAAVLEPEAQAKKKIRLGLKKKVQKKRKREQSSSSRR